MMKNKKYELIRKVIEDGMYKIQEDDGEQLVIRYQFNSIHICLGDDDDHFVSIILTNFAEVNEDNYADVIMRCNRLNAKLKQVKLYTMNDAIIAASEFFYHGKRDLAYQIRIGVKSVIAAKVNYHKLD